MLEAVQWDRRSMGGGADASFHLVSASVGGGRCPWLVVGWLRGIAEMVFVVALQNAWPKVGTQLKMSLPALHHCLRTPSDGGTE